MIHRRDDLPAVDTGSDGPGTPHEESQSTEREGIFLFKPVSIAFCTSGQAWTRRVHCFASTRRRDRRRRKQLLQNKPLLARSLQDHRRNDSSKGWQHRLPSKASSLTLGGVRGITTFLSRRMSVSYTVCSLFLFSCTFLFFSSCVFVCNFLKQVR